MRKFELVHIEWSDYGDKVEVLDTVEAETEYEAAVKLTADGQWYSWSGSLREVDSHLSQPLDVVLAIGRILTP